MQIRNSAFHLGAFVGAMCVMNLAMQPGTARRPYLLSATTTEHTDKTYPAELYQVTADGKLRAVREIVARTDGVRLVQTWGEAIFLIHPHVVSTAVAVVHTEAPEVVDDVVFDPHGRFPVSPWVAAAEPTPAALSLLIPLSAEGPDGPSRQPALVSISSNAAERTPRLRFDSWSEYAEVRLEGSYGGPTIVPYFVGSTAASKLVVSVLGHSVDVDTLPPSVQSAAAKTPPAVVVASRDWLVLDLDYARQDQAMSKLDVTERFVHDRVHGRWKTIQIDGNASGLRLFGSWLATRVGMRNPEHKASPGRESERGKETDRLPNVQEQYSIFAGKWIWFPGILTLQDLADGRKIRMETGQEDSEILRVDGDIVLYRVNDAIYQARIVGDQLKDSTIIVKDEDVPEIHWAFWSK